MIDFYSHQENARTRSRSLLWRFILANLLLVALLSAALWFGAHALGISEDSSSRTIRRMQQESDGLVPVILLLDLAVLVTVLISAAIKFRTLSSRGGAVAETLGAHKVSPETTDPLERRYLNVVEEMAIASNLPVPEVYVLDDQDGINAFASGPTPEHSAVAVTRGALQRLSRDELQGVVAHEFSHILHGDVRLNIRLAAYIFGLVVLTFIGRTLFDLMSRSGRRSSSRSKKGGGEAVILVVALFFLLLGLLGRFVSILLSAAISREREFLADATAVQLTRNPDGIAGALKKIGGHVSGSVVTGPNTAGLSHFFLANAHTPGFFDSLYATHPPLVKRIQRIDPNFQGAFPDSDSISLQVGDEVSMVSQFNAGRIGAAVAAGTDSGGAAPSSFEAPFLHSDWLPPADLHSAIVGAGSAEGIVCTLLLSPESDVRRLQIPMLDGWINSSELSRYEAACRGLSLHQKLSVVLLALPTIQSYAKKRRASFNALVERLVDADGQGNLLEFLVSVLIHFATEETDPSFKIRGGTNRERLEAARAPLEILLSVCTWFSARDEEGARQLFAGACADLKVSSWSYVPGAERDVARFFTSITQIRNSSPRLRARVMGVCEKIVLRDGRVTEAEAAVMRLVAILLRAALPESIEPTWDGERVS